MGFFHVVYFLFVSFLRSFCRKYKWRNKNCKNLKIKMGERVEDKDWLNLHWDNNWNYTTAPARGGGKNTRKKRNKKRRTTTRKKRRTTTRKKRRTTTRKKR